LQQVVANAVAALTDIHEAAQSLSHTPTADASEDGTTSPPPSAKPNSQLFIIDPPTLTKLLVALNECSEWGRIAILSTLARYKAHDHEESEHICERVMPQFQHVNAAVVLGAVKVRRQNPRCGSVMLMIPGDHDPHEERSSGRSPQVAHPQNGSSAR
jgi:vesicle coat complex subunit